MPAGRIQGDLRSARTLARVVAAAALAFGAVSLCCAQERVLDDPLPLKRVQVPLNRVLAEMDRAKQGVLVQLPRADFEERVQAAAKASQAKKQGPRLARASYAADFDGQMTLVGRRGHWTVVNPGPAPALLPLGDCNLALGDVKNDEARQAILGELTAKGLSLQIEKTDTQEFIFDWSLRGTTAVDGVHFDLRVPPSALASLELRVPVEYRVTTPRGGAMASAAEAGKKASHRVWTIHFSGRSQVELIIAKGAGSGTAPPVVLSQIQSTQQLMPGHVVADFDVKVEVLHQETSRLVFDCDPALQPYRVVPVAEGQGRVLDVDGWDFQEGASPDERDPNGKPGAPGTLAVNLREGFQGGPATLRISCLAPVPGNRPWTSPGIRLRNSLSRGEQLKLLVRPDVALERWERGDFRVLDGQYDSEGKQTLVLSDRGEAAALRPRAILKSQSAEFLASQRLWWRIGPQGAALSTETTYELAHGRLFQLGLKLPKGGKGWRVDAVEVQPKDLLRHWVAAGPTLLLDLQRPLTPQLGAKVTVKLVTNQPLSQGPTVVDFPDLEPAERCWRQGTLGISPDTQFQATAVEAPPAAANPDADGPWGAELPAYLFAFRGTGPAGKLRLVPQTPRLRTQLNSDAVLTPRGGALHARIELEALVGRPQSVDILLPIVPQGRWQWHLGQSGVRSAERQPWLDAAPDLLALGSGQGLIASMIVCGVVPRAEVWRLTLDRPLTARTTVTAEASLTPRPVAGKEGVQVWDIPFPLPVQGGDHDAQVTLDIRGAKLQEVVAHGLEEIASGPNGKTNRTDTARRFRYAPATGVRPRLIVTTQALADVPTQELCPRAQLTSYVEPGKPVVHHFAFHVANWQRRPLPVVLPEGSRVMAAQIDGHWLREIPQQSVPEGVAVEFAAPYEGEHEFGIVYESAHGLSSLPLAWAAAPVPKLPVPAIVLRRVWRLGPGLMPLQSAQLQEVALPDNASPRSALGRIWTVADQALGVPGLRGPEDSTATQRQLVAGAEAALRRTLTADTSLGAALERLAVDHLKDQAVLVLDTVAFQEHGLVASSRLVLSPKDAGPFWERLGLAYMACRDGALLTTAQTLEAWVRAGGSPASFARAHESAVLEAARSGRDGSGRFCTVSQWLLEPPRADGLRPLLPDTSAPGWSEWHWAAGVEAADEILLLERSGIRVSAILLTGLLLTLALVLRGRFSWRWQFRLLAVWLAAAGLGIVWLPNSLGDVALWLGAGGLLLFVLAYARALRTAAPPGIHEARPTDKILKAASTATIALLFCIVPPALLPRAHSQGADPYVVLLLPGPADAPNQQVVLVTPELLKRLDDMTRPSGSGRQPAFIGARYKGTFNDTGVLVSAEYQLFSPDSDTSIVLPLAGVDLRERVFLDGRPVYPVALPGPAQGYRVPVGSRGLHRLELSFHVRIGPFAEELRFTVPKVAQSYLELAVPGSFQAVEATTAQGQQTATADGSMQVLRARLGRESNVVVQWRRNARPPLPANIQVAEAYVWDIRSPAAALTGILTYSVSNGVIGKCAINLPAGIHVRQVEAVEPGTPAMNLVKNWLVSGKGDKRLLQIELTKLISTKVQIKLSLVPRVAVEPGSVSLRLPLPLNVKHAEGFLAYRFQGPETSDKRQNLGVTSIAPEAFTKVWKAAGQGKIVPTRAYSFQRTAGNAGLLVTLPSAKPRATSALSWRVAHQHADFEASVQLVADEENLLVIEAAIPAGVTLTAVRGPLVRSWSHVDGRVQIWLDKLCAETTLQLRGYAKLAQKLTPTQPGRFVLPIIRMPGLEERPGTVQLMPAPGIVLDVEGMQDLVRTAPGPASALMFTTTGPKLAATFRLRQVPQPADTQILTVLETVDGTARFTSYVDYWAPPGEGRAVTVQLRGWPTDAVRLEVPGPAGRTEPRKQADTQTWVAHVPPGMARRLTFKLSGQAPAHTGAALPVPDVSVPGGNVQARFVALAGSNVPVQEQVGLERVANPANDVRLWPAAAHQLGRQDVVWRIRQTPWKLTLVPKVVEAPPSIDVLLAYQEAVPAQDRRWLHRCVWLLLARSETELSVRLPAGARAVAARVDGRFVGPRLLSDEALALALPKPRGLHTVALEWMYAADAEPVEKPNLAPALLTNALRAGGPVRLLIPPGAELGGASADAVMFAAGRALEFVQTARAYHALSALLAKPEHRLSGFSSNADVLDAQRRFYGCCRQAAYHLALAARAKEDVAPLGASLEALRARNRQLAQDAGFEPLRAQAEKQPALPEPAWETDRLSLPDAGHFLVWSAPPEDVTLLLTSQERLEQSILLSHLLLVMLLLALVLSYFPRLARALAWFWPEQLCLIALLGIWLLGMSVLALALLSLGVMARLLILILLLRRWRMQTAPASGEAAPAEAALPPSASS